MLSILTDSAQTIVNIETESIHSDNLEDINADISEVICPHETIIIDLDNVKYVDSCALALFVRLHKIANEQAAKLFFSNLHPKIYSLLRTTNLDSILQIINTEKNDVSSPSILIVDDFPIICKALDKSLATRNLKNVHIAHNGAEALIKAHQIKPKFILLDYYMPIMNGGDCLPVLKKNHPDAKIFMMSAEDEVIKLPDAVRVDSDHFFVKHQRMGDEVSDYIINEKWH